MDQYTRAVMHHSSRLSPPFNLFPAVPLATCIRPLVRLSTALTRPVSAPGSHVFTADAQSHCPPQRLPSAHAPAQLQTANTRRPQRATKIPSLPQGPPPTTRRSCRTLAALAKGIPQRAGRSRQRQTSPTGRRTDPWGISPGVRLRDACESRGGGRRGADSGRRRPCCTTENFNITHCWCPGRGPVGVPLGWHPCKGRKR